MHEPASNTKIFAGLAAAVLELTGIPMPPLVWAFVGAALCQAYSQQVVTRWRALAQIITSGFAGAIFGLFLAESTGIKGKYATLAFCVVGGVFAYPIAQRLINKFLPKGSNDA